MAKKLTTEEFIEKAKKIHGDKYDYSLVNYIDTKTKVKIICPKHGIFEQTPNSHLRGNGCSECYKERQGRNFLLTTEEFIEKAKKIHGDKYDYSHVDYIKSSISVEIICPVHGSFFQTPNNHLQGKGCNLCGYEHASIVQRDSLEEFIEKANKVHNNKYDYSQVVYTNNRSKITIICPVHGPFIQEASSHLCGKGCPVCCSSRLEVSVRNFLDIKQINYSEQYTWDWLIFDKSQYVDFYLPDYNSVIECQGLQHFCENEFFDKSEPFDIRWKRDINKRDLCIKHGIKMYYFSNIVKDNQVDKNFVYPYLVFEDLDKLINTIMKNYNGLSD